MSAPSPPTPDRADGMPADLAHRLAMVADELRAIGADLCEVDYRAAIGEAVWLRWLGQIERMADAAHALATGTEITADAADAAMDAGIARLTGAPDPDAPTN